MTKVASRRLVIDASIALAAGNTANLKQVCQPHQDFLETVLVVCHRVVLTPDLLEEWNNHAARFARTWLRRMFGRRKVEVIQANPILGLEGRTCNTAQTDQQRAAIQKDMRLVHAALTTDKRIISQDDTMRALLARASEHVHELQTIVWVNPANAADNSLEWLKVGAPEEGTRRLDSHQE